MSDYGFATKDQNGDTAINAKNPIFGFDMGVKGAAIATVIGQILTFAMSIYYLTKSKNFAINKEALKIEGRTLGRIVSVGMASLIVQLSIVVIIAVNTFLILLVIFCEINIRIKFFWRR